MARTAVEIVRAYGVDAWTQGRDDLIPELCHDPIIRHDADRDVRLSHAEQRARMRHNFEELRPVFEDVVLAGDDEHVTLVWNVTGRDPNFKWCGIEVFRVVDGRIAEVWNSTYMDGRWGLSKSLTGTIADGSPFPLPLMRADLSFEGERVTGRFVVPAEPNGLAAWLCQLLGKPAVDSVGGQTRRYYTAGGDRVSLNLTVADKIGPATGLAQVTLPSLTIEWERSGLINAAFDLTADQAPPTNLRPSPLPHIRLSETFGSFEGADIVGRAVEAGITIASDGTASGRVTLRSDHPIAGGPGKLRIGWREGERLLSFEGNATLSDTSGGFEDGDKVQASYRFTGAGFSATLVGATTNL